MKTGIWQLAGVTLLCLGISVQAMADEQDNSHRQDQLRGSNERREQNNNVQRQQQQQMQQQQNQQRNVERQQQQQVQQVQQNQERQIQQQQNQQRQVERQQQQQIQQNQQNQQRQIQEQQNQQRQVERQQQQQIQQNQRNQERQIQEQQNQQRQIERQQAQQRQNNLPIQGGPREAWQTQPPREGYYRDIPRNNNNYRPNDRWPGRPDGHGNGWGPGPQYRPGYEIDRVPGGYSRIPYRGQDYFYSGGYWYRPQGPRYVVVTPPYGVRVRSLPSYASEVWVGGALLFLAAGTYYAYQPDTQDYVVATPPANVDPGYAQQPPPQVQQPVQQGQQPGTQYDPQFSTVNGQSQEQMGQDRYECYSLSVQQTGLDPANVTYQPDPSLIDAYRRSMTDCLLKRGYSVNFN
jgi:hypothetical protein